MGFKQEIIGLLAKQTSLKQEEVENLLAIPPDPKLGDYAFPCFKLGISPKQEAEALKKKIKLPSFLSRIEVAGPYLNFFLNPAIVAEEILAGIKKEKEHFGKGKGKNNIVIEFCGPNTNKPLHLGHLRNMALGDAACRLLQFQGNKVHPVNIVNDRGIHICQSMLAYQKWGKDKKPDRKGDHFVGDYYVLFSQKAQGNEELKKEAQEMLLKWERGDKEIRELWKKMTQWVLSGFSETYKRFGIKFEKEYFESKYYEKGKEIVREGLRKKVFEKDHTDAVIAPMEKFGLTNKVLLRGDETSLYITQDMYLAELRYQDFKFDKLVYVVASEQNLHFKQLFKILELLKKFYAKNLFHLSYGMVHLPSGRMKSREGTVIDADDLMDEMAGLAEKEVRKRYKNLSEEEIRQRSESIALAAIKFFMLRTDAQRDITFNPEESLSFEGETGPYLQYTHARSCSILRKAGEIKKKAEGKAEGKVKGKGEEKISLTADFTLLKQPQEKSLLNLLMNFPSVAEKSAQNYQPHLLCRYLLDLAQAFNEFYHAHPVISDDEAMMKVRLLLVDGVRQVLENGLNLLGIKAMKEM